MVDGEGSGGFEWRCENCGERSPKHNPPCTNCGGMQFEKTELDPMAEYEAAESLVPTTRRALVAYSAAGVAALTGGGYLLYEEYTEPTVPDAPGSADSAGGISFATVESSVLERVNDERDSSLQTSESVQSAARYATAYTLLEGEEGSARELYGRLDGFHIGTFRVVRRVFASGSGDGERAIDGFESAEGLVTTLATSWLNSDDERAFLLADQFTEGGVDVHVDPDGDVYAAFVVATGGDGLL